MFPILDFDNTSKPIIEPSLYIDRLLGAECCVLCFFKEVIGKVVDEYSAKVVAELSCEMGISPIYEIEYNKKRISFFKAINRIF